MAPQLQPANDLLDFLNLTSINASTFATTTLPSTGPTGRAFGGCTIAVALTAATSTVPTTHKVFSALGNFLSGASGDRAMTASVKVIRTTRSFATRYVEVSQRLDTGEDRVCMVVLLDYQVPDAHRDGTFEYSEPPSRAYTPLSACPLTPDLWGPIDKPSMRTRTIEQRHCPEGYIGQTVGQEVRVKTTQDELPMHKRTSADWFRPKVPLKTNVEQAAFLAFVLDGPSSWLPLLHDQQDMKDFEAVASLEFALRFFGSDLGGLDGDEWWLREVKSTVAAEGRTFMEGKVWDAKGRCMASMTQQDIARPRKQKSAEKL